MSKNVWHIEIREQEKYAWVIDPDMRPKIRYIKTHRCVYYVPCHACNARQGQPCVGSSGESRSEVHPVRRDLFYKRVTLEAAVELGKKIKMLKGAKYPKTAEKLKRRKA